MRKPVRLTQTCVIKGTFFALVLTGCGVGPGGDPAASASAAAAQPALAGPVGEPPNNRIVPPHAERFRGDPFPVESLPGLWRAPAGCEITLVDGGDAAAARCAAPLDRLARWRSDAENPFRINFYARDGAALGHALRLRADTLSLWSLEGMRTQLHRAP